MKKVFWLWFMLLLFLSVPVASAQDTLPDPVPGVDSALLKQIEAQRLLLQAERQRIEDSIRTLELKEQIELLKEIDRLRNEELQNLAARNELRFDSVGFPVAPFGDTLFFIHTKMGALRAEERAELISGRILQLSEREFTIDSLLLQTSPEGTEDITYGEIIIMSVSDYDALALGSSKTQLAGDYLGRIEEALLEAHSTNGILKFLIQIGLTIIAILGFAVLLKLVSHLFTRFNAWVILNKDKFFNGIRFKNYHFLTPETELEWAIKANRFFKFGVYILLFYVTLLLIFSLFPFSRGWAIILFNWAWEPFVEILYSMWSYLPNVITILVIFFVTRYIIKFLGFLASEVELGRLQIPGFFPDWVKPTFTIVKILLYAFMFVVIFPYLPGADSPIFRGVSVFLGILFSLGSSNAIANMVAGFVITYMRAFKIGDRIKIGDVVGVVLEKTMLVTRIRTIKNEDITVPNAMVLSSHTINYSSSATDPGLIIHTSVTIGYDEPWRKVHKALEEAAAKTKLLTKDPKPFVLQTSLDDFFVTYQINAYTNEPTYHIEIYSVLHQNIQDVFNEQGIEILSPHYRNIRDGNATTIPSDHLPKDYIAPAFRIKKEQ